MNAPHAVRWAIREAPFETIWTKWHWTEDACWTLCKRFIPLGPTDPHLFPETEDEPDRVNCKLCLQKMEAQ